MPDTIKKLLIIDDDNFLLDIYSVKFKESGFEVTASFRAEDALLKIQAGYAPDVILFDMVMPGLDGIGFLESLRSQNLVPNAALVVLSNQSQDSDIEKARKYNIGGYIIKANNTPSEVVEQVKSVLHTNS